MNFAIANIEKSSMKEKKPKFLVHQANVRENNEIRKMSRNKSMIIFFNCYANSFVRCVAADKLDLHALFRL